LCGKIICGNLRGIRVFKHCRDKVALIPPTCFREYAKETGFGMEFGLYLGKKFLSLKNEYYFLN